jgi:hypothetical protein
MPRGSKPKSTRPKAAGRTKAPKRTEDYRYPDKQTNNPEAGLQSFDRKVPAKVRYEYDPHSTRSSFGRRKRSTHRSTSIRFPCTSTSGYRRRQI